MLHAIILFAMLCSSAVSAEGLWTTYTDTNEVKDIVTYGDYIWCATTGGAVRINRNNGSFHVFRMEDGIADNHVNAVAVDSTGTVWFGTNRGLSQYNGISWKTWNTANGLKDTTVSDIAVDSSGRVWITMNGRGNDAPYGKQPFNYEVLQSYDGKSWITHISEKGYMSGGFTSLVLDEVHKWIWTKGFVLIKYDIQKSRYETFPFTEAIPNTVPCAIDRQGIAWFLKNGNPITFDGSAWVAHTPEDSSLAGHLQTMVIDGNNVKWFSTDRGLARYDDQTWTLQKPVRFPEDNPTRLYTVDEDNGVWCVSPSGVTRITNGKVDVFGTDIRLPGNHVRSVTVDRDNVKWFGFENQGVASFDGTAWKLYTVNDGLADNHTSDIAVDRNNVKWFGSTDGGVSRFDGKTWATYSKETGSLADNNVSALAIDADNVLWVGMYSGDVASFDGNTWKNHPGCGKWIKDMVFDREGRLWVATSGDYLWEWNGKGWYQVRSFLSYDLCSLAVDHEDVVWVGSGNGAVARIRNGAMESIAQLPTAVGISLITSISEDKNGILWFTFHSALGIGGGVASYDRKSWTMYTPSTSGLVCKESWGVAVDRDNNKWFATDEGVSSFLDNPSEKYIRVIAPAGGEQWDSGTVRRITWQSKKVESIRIEYSADSGGNWKTVAAGFPASVGYYDWICFEPVTSRGRIRLSDNTSSGISGVCKEDFTILAPVYATDQGTWTFIPYPPSNSFPSRTDYPQFFEVTALEVDHSGAVWAGLFGGQVFRFSNDSWTSFTSKVTGFPNMIKAICTDRNNNVWFASETGVSRFNGIDWKKFEFLEVQSISDIAEDKDNVLWLPGKNGIIQLNPDGSYRAHMFGELTLPSALSVAVDGNNMKWFGLYDSATEKGDIVSFDGNEWKSYSGSVNPEYSGLPALHISAGIDNILCFSTDHEAYTLSNGRIMSICRNDYISDSAADKNGSFWIIERDVTVHWDQVSTFDSIRWERRTDRINFPGNQSFFDHFSRIAMDGDNTLLFSAEYGLWRFDIGGKPLPVKQNDPHAFDLLTNYPNPFNSSTTITFSLSAMEKTELSVFSITGQKIRSLASEPLSAGTHSMCWDGRDDMGTPVASGMYIARLRASNHTSVSKMMLLR